MMRKLTLVVAAALFAVPGYADISTGNPDLEFWVAEDHALLNRTTRTVGVEMREGISRDNGDLYGWAIEDDALLSVKYTKYEVGPAEADVGDSYGSILHSVGFHW